MDMHSPYTAVVHDVFPKANIVIDKFHIVQLLSRSLNKARIRYMNEVKSKKPVLYRRLKKNWQLFLNFGGDLSMERPYYYNRSYKAYISESEIIADLLRNSSEELKETYYLYQRLLYSMRIGLDDLFFEEIDSKDNKKSEYLSADMKKSLKTLRKFRIEIGNMFSSKLTNGCIEGINNLVKTIKRVSFGYINFEHFRIRIRLALSSKNRVGGN